MRTPDGVFHPTEWSYRQINKDGEVLWEQDWTPNVLADEGEQLILDVFFRNATAPTNFYIGVVNDTPGEGDTLSTLTGEPATGGYSRSSYLVERSNTGWPTLEVDGTGYRVVSTTETITATGASIGPVTYAFLATSSDNSGDLIAYNALSQSRTLADGDSLEITMRIKLD